MKASQEHFLKHLTSNMYMILTFHWRIRNLIYTQPVIPKASRKVAGLLMKVSISPIEKSTMRGVTQQAVKSE